MQASGAFDLLYAIDLAQNVSPSIECNYYIDQLALTLIAWGNSVGRNDLQLAYVLPGGQNPVFAPTTSDNPQVIFIYNNNALGNEGGPTYNHYEGLQQPDPGAPDGAFIVTAGSAGPAPAETSGQPADDDSLADYESYM